MTRKRKFAVFDIDGTLYRSSLFLDMIEEIHAEGLLPASATKEYEEKKERWTSRTHDDAYSDFVIATLKHVDEHYMKLSCKNVERIGNKVVKERHRKTYIYTTRLLKKLQNEGYVTLAISGSNSELVEPFAQKYELDGFRCSYWHRTEDGEFYTGTWTEAGHNKKAVLTELIDAHNLTTDGSIAVGDTGSDIAMLEMVDHPIAFNPDQKLLDRAKEENWKVVIERKSIAFELDPVDGKHILV